MTCQRGPEADFDRNERSAAVRAALATLGERDREALLLKAEGFNTRRSPPRWACPKARSEQRWPARAGRLVEAYRSEGRGKNVAS